jgi:hypothetical protein
MPIPSCQQGGKRLLLKLELRLSSSDSSGRVVGRKGLTMGGFFKVLLGGALGAVLGIMFMKKQRAVKPDQPEQLPAARREPEAAPPPAAPVVPVVPVAPVAAPVAPEVVPPVAAAAVAPAVAAPPVAAPPAPEPVVLVPPAPEPVVAVAPEPVVIPEPTPAPMPVPEPAPEPAAVLPEPEAETPVTPAVVPAAAVAAVVAAEVSAPVEAPPVPENPASEPAESHPAAWLAGAALAGAAAAQTVEAAPAAAVEPEVVVVPPLVVAPPETVEPMPPVQAAPEAPVYMSRVPSFVEAEAVAATAAAQETPAFDETSLSAEASEVLVTPELLEEPLPGAGWEPSAVFVQEEVELEELLPVVSDDVKPYEAPLIAPEEGTDEAWDVAGWPEAAPAAAVGSAFPEEEPVPEWAAVAPFAAARVDEAPERPETVAGFEPEVESEVIAEPAAGAEAGGAVELTTEAAVGEDLRSRIEETRRRIREELEKPFAAVDEETPAVTPPPVTPAAAAAAATVVGEPMQTAVQPPRDGAVASAASAEPSDEDASDYDAMRARIELTRSRLKAKAFDAMMAGESSLLGRDLGGTSGPTGPTASFDSEIEQTVDSTLREEDQ